MGDSEFMKSRLNTSVARLGINKYNKNDPKIVDKYIDRVWNQFGNEIKSHGESGEPITKQEFTNIFKAYYRQEGTLDPSAKMSTKLKKALTKYDRSSLYRDTGERLNLISSETIFEDPETADIFRRMAGMKKKDRFDLSKYQFTQRGETSEGKEFTVHKYNNVYVVQLNSPLVTLILNQQEFENSEYNQ